MTTLQKVAIIRTCGHIVRFILALALILAASFGGSKLALFIVLVLMTIGHEFSAYLHAEQDRRANKLWEFFGRLLRIHREVL